MELTHLQTDLRRIPAILFASPATRGRMKVRGMNRLNALIDPIMLDLILVKLDAQSRLR